jgi:hypothetical protein
VFCSNPNKVSLVVHIAVSVFHFSVHSVFSRVALCFMKNYSM